MKRPSWTRVEKGIDDVRRRLGREEATAWEAFSGVESMAFGEQDHRSTCSVWSLTTGVGEDKEQQVGGVFSLVRRHVRAAAVCLTAAEDFELRLRTEVRTHRRKSLSVNN